MRTRNFITAAAAIVISTGMLFASGAIKLLFHVLFSANYLPHRFCYLAQPGLIWSNVAADLLTALSYVVIFAALFWLANNLRRLPRLRGHLWIFASFGLFILACGATHVMETVTIWWPVYRLSVVIKTITAAASIGTAILFVSSVGTIATDIRRFFDLIASEHAQAALRKNEDHLDRIFDIARVGGWELDLETMRVTWSKQMFLLHGAAPDFVPTVERGLSFFEGPSISIPRSELVFDRFRFQPVRG